MGRSVILLSILALVFFSNIVFAYDPSPLQDFCVADLTNTVRLNGLPCKDPAKVEAEDFFFSGLHVGGNTSNPMGSAFSAVTVNQMPGLNTLGVVIARLDFEPNGFLPPHFHARATEILTVLEGSMEVGFVTSSPSFRHYKKVLEKGDVFVVPVGLIHYQRNVGAGSIVAIAALNSQNPGITALPNAVFGANPDIDSGYLARAFDLDKKTVEELQQKF
ncbi:putative germin-like protein 2-1 [Salvia miltiorrhiza]|uniref:putative germin-like protein 2-1 n=1 Tax=Salvia miltiorrhiza TaxID=226208 RepID=UPI0025ACE31E|nr:putative germin-like protein 2-1 [Salvia miltiorrhiza]